ncbi:M20 family metallopeptidase [Phaeacidiphilus oryzae]|uniref:M20 family metallopeptidase n=1 Tax=Phaeacidiphilus oryzae TaxID=348818 RepID=UPI000A514C37|nr:M20 family metallopeptidase [Phaeacidiphilus oryzae]
MNIRPETPATAADRRAQLSRLRDWVALQRTAMLADLRRYVNLETPSDDRGCLQAALPLIERWLVDSLGTPERRRRVDGGDYGDTLVLDWSGTGDAPVVLLCHYDTVWSRGTVERRSFALDGDRATGPGIFDMKAGLVQAVWALRALDAAGLPRPAVRLVLNGDEEVGSLSSRPVIEAEAAGAPAVLVFEASADSAVKTARKGVGLFRLTATGREAHAGLDPTKGVSAVDEIARAILAVHGLSRPEAGTTVNVGTVHGGTRSNVTAGRAVADLDVRVADRSEAERIDRGLAALRPHHPEASIEVGGEWNRPVMERTPGGARLYDLARRVASDLGFALRECSVGGASDGNFAAALGLPVLDGLGAVGDGAHARSEHISVSGMTERCALAAGVLLELGTPVA